MKTLFKGPYKRCSCHVSIVCLFLLSACTASRNFRADRKFAAETLRADYRVFRGVLEENHPSIYWYTSKDSLDYYFDAGYARIKDSMTEIGFRNILNYTIAKINCGHTTVNYSKELKRHLDTSQLKRFPLSIKLWGDTAVVYANLNRHDTILKRGTIITAIDGRPMSFYRDSLIQFLSTDGYNINHKYQTLSGRTSFATLYKNVFGLKDSFRVSYLDTLFAAHSIQIPVFDPNKDTSLKKINFPRMSHAERKQLRLRANNNLVTDTSAKTALLTINTFTSGDHIKHFIRKSFRKLRQEEIRFLIIDVRNNGGGDVSNSTLLTKYITDKKFKIADSLYAVSKKSRYGKHIRHYFRNRVFMAFIAKKREDGKYHYGYFERHYFKPRKTNHFNGDVYAIIGPNSFSATTLFINSIKGMPNVKIIGEETGGGSYGNTAWQIPDVTLPHTKIRFRLPLFRFVQNSNNPKTGRGIYPDMEVKPTVESIFKGYDVKLEFIRKLIYGEKLSRR
ncbi:MAG: peptidase S41 [Chitinophagaceae bacterium]|nr:peptidase S41 [Chitinophagaceae bacterium]